MSGNTKHTGKASQLTAAVTKTNKPSHSKRQLNHDASCQTHWPINKYQINCQPMNY